MTATLKIKNRLATPNETEFNVEEFAIPDIVNWYSAFYAGDPYSVFVNGTKQKLDHNGRIDGEVLE